MLKKTTMILAVLVNIPVSIFAARPFITDDAGTVERSGFELECASDYWKDLALFGATLKHGLNGSWCGFWLYGGSSGDESSPTAGIIP